MRKNHRLQLLILALAFGLLCAAPAAWSQTSSTGGNLNVSVSDQSGGAVPNASLEVKDLSTNVVTRGVTQGTGKYTFQDLPGGTYSLTVSATGFSNEVFESVIIKTSLETTVQATLKIGTTSESVTVNATEAPMVQTEASTISNNIDTKQIFNLPDISRDVFGLIYTVPGYVGNSFNNLPSAAIISSTVDGTMAKSNRFRDSTAYGQTDVQFRMENMDEFTVTTGQMDLGGNGTSAMGISAVYKRGGNQFHGSLFEDFRNTILNANSWSRNSTTNAQGVGSPRSITKYNQFGGTIGGPVVKNKLFFYGSFSILKQPNTTLATAALINPVAQQGIYQFPNTAGGITSINLFQLAAANGLPSTVNPVIGGQLAKINGVLNQGITTPNATDPNQSTFSWANVSANTSYFPTIKLDYNATSKFRISATYTEQKNLSPFTNSPNWPTIDTVDRTSSNSNSDIGGLTFEYSPTPTLFNNLHLGYLYEYSIFDPENLGLDYSTLSDMTWGIGTGLTTGNFPRRAISSLYSDYSLNDSLTWQHNKHTVVAGFSGFREWDRYWNGPGGEPRYSVSSLSTLDPAYSVITNAIAALPNGGTNTTFQSAARALYSTLTGDIASVSLQVGRPVDPATKQYKPFGQYNLNEVQQSQGFWLQDRWRVLPSLTLNYGLRWDVVGDDYDKDGAYTSARSLADLYGPTPVGAMFKPGATGGVGDPLFTASVHKYNTMWKNPQPSVAIAWNPSVEDGILGKIMGKNKTVIRTGYSLRNYQDGAQNTWAFGSDGGGFFYQGGSYNPDPNLYGQPGYFKAGTLFLGTPNPTPNYLLTPTTYSTTVPGDQVFGNSEYNVNPHIRLPYVQSWNFGIQRELPGGQAIEINYVGNLVLHSWVALNLNEVNIFENGFLPEFKNAQNNMAINVANGKGTTPFNFGLPGQVALPILTAAYGPTNNSSFTGMATNLTNGAAGSAASSLLSAGPLCNLVGGANFKPCAGIAGAGYPLNFLNINPYARANGLNYLDSSGMSDYEGLQMQYRTRLNHGAQFTANYTYSHSLLNGSYNNIQSQGYSPYTLRNLNLNYADSSNDIRHVLHVLGTYDLPFGRGRKFVNYGGVINGIFGGWTLGTITTISTAGPTTMTGGYGTVNNLSTSGVNFLQGLTAKQLQDSLKIQHTGACTASGCNGWVQEFAPYVIAGGTADPNYFTPGTTPGSFAQWPVIRGPWFWTSDASANKSITVHEKYRLTIQATATNVFNHPTIGLGSLSILGTTFGRATPGGSRAMALRANIIF